MRCTKCGEEEVLPFKCAYCGEYFCSRHRLPEAHECRAIYLARNLMEVERAEGRGQSTPPRATTLLAVKTEMLLSKLASVERGSELIHLLAGSAIVAGVAFSMIYSVAARLGPSLVALIILSVIAAFIAHELAHKVEAIRQKSWARFKLNLFGSMVSLISIILPMKFIAPGAVVIFGHATSKGVARIAAAGPAVNLIFGASILPIIFIAYTLVGAIDYNLTSALVFIGEINVLMGLVNLIPLGPLDGMKIITTSFRAWLSYMVLAVVMFAIYLSRLPLLI